MILAGPQGSYSARVAVHAPMITVATFNFAQGGSHRDGTWDLRPAVAYIAEQVPDLDVLFFQEAEGYQRDGGKRLYETAELLHRVLGGSWGAHLALNSFNPHDNAVFFRHDVLRVAQAWPDPSDPDLRSQYAGSLWAHVDGLPERLVLTSVHWSYYSRTIRTEQAGRLGNMIPLPAIVGGDMNGLWPGSTELRPSWEELPPHLAMNKTVSIYPTSSALESDLEAGWLNWRQGWVDVGALANNTTPTTNPPERAPCRIDRIMVSPCLGAGIDTSTYTVHNGSGALFDHRLVSVRIDLGAYGEAFHAPWWDEPAFRGWTYGGASAKEDLDPTAYQGWIRRKTSAAP